MAYIGNNLTVQQYNPQIAYFTGNGSTTAFTLPVAVVTAAQIIVTVNNVIQNPTYAFTVSGTTLTFTSAPPSNATTPQNIWVEYTSLQTNLIQPANNTVGTAQLVNGTVVTTVDASIHGLTVGLGGGSQAYNTVVGISGLANNSSGNYNSAFGANWSGVLNGPLYSNTTGTWNSAYSLGSLGTNTTGSYNTAYGASSLAQNTTASNNTAVGYQAGYSNSTGTGQVFIGYQSGLATTTGNYNTFVGNAVAPANTTGANNTGLGLNALFSNTTGSQNTALGGGIGGSIPSTLYLNTTGSYNTAVGNAALAYNTTASNNTAVGYQAGYSNTTGAYLTFLGYQAGYSNLTGSANTFIGYSAGYSVTTGIYNTFIGSASATGYSGGLITTGSKNTIIGNYTGNQGSLDIRTASNYIVLSDGDGNPRGIFDSTGQFLIGGVTGGSYGGSMVQQLSAGTVWSVGPITGQTARWYVINGSGTGVYIADGATSWTANSDERLKTDLNPIEDAANKVSTLRAVTGRYKTDKEGTSRSFLIAQDVQKVLPEAINDSDPEALGVQYTDVIPLLVAAIKELNATVTAQAATIAALQAKVGI